MDGPPAKRSKLLPLNEVSRFLKQAQQWQQSVGENDEGEFTVDDTKSLHRREKRIAVGALERHIIGTGVCEKVHAFSDEEEDEATQIESSLPLYLKYAFGPFIGQSQLDQTAKQSEKEEIAKQYNLMSVESQGFLYTASQSQKLSPCHPQKVETSLSSECPESPLLFTSPVSACKDPSTCNLTSEERGDGTTIAATISTSSSSSSTHKVPTGSPKHCGHTSSDVKTEELQTTVERIEEEGSGSSDAGKMNTTVGAHRKRKRSLSHLNPGHLSVGYAHPPSCTCLAKCTEVDKTVSLFAIVLQVNPVMEVSCKSGSMAGQTVQMSSLLLGDPTKSYFKLTLWREAAVWVERIAAGDITYFKNIKLKRWRKEMVGHTVMYSSVLNLHQPKKTLPVKVCEMVPSQSLDGLKQWAVKIHGHLFEGNSPKSQRLVCFKTSQELGMDSVVHFRAKLVALVSSRVVVIADDPEREIHLYLLSNEASLWSSHLSSGVGQVWEFMYVAFTSEETQGGYYLQTTSRSQLGRVKSGCEIARAILKKFPVDVGNPFVIKGCSFREVLRNKESGTFAFKAVALSSFFLLLDGLRLSLWTLLESSTLDLVSTLCQAVYVGCETCSKPLKQDENGVYCQCAACMAKKPGAYPSSSYYFRPLAIVLKDSTGCVEVTATHAIIPKVLGIAAVDVVKAGLAEDHAQCGRVKLAVSTFQTVAQCLDGSIWTISCVVIKDENSFMESISLSLLDWNTV